MQFPSFMGLVAGTGGTREEALEVPLRLGLAIGIVQSELNLRAEIFYQVCSTSSLGAAT